MLESMKRGRKIMTDNSKGIISLKKVNKGYAGKQVIFDVNLNVRAENEKN